MTSQFHIIFQSKEKIHPRDYEMSAALIIAQYFKTDVVFLKTGINKTPDFEISGTRWELKSPIGNSKNTIHNTLSSARKQSHNIIIDLRRCKMHQSKAIAQIKYYYTKRHHKNSRILIISKKSEVIDSYAQVC